MPLDIKIDCYFFSIKRRNTRNTTRLNFEEFYLDLLPGTVQIPTLALGYQAFYQELLDYFSREFRVNIADTKGVGIPQTAANNVTPNDNIISGFVYGGGTGIGKSLHARNDTATGNQVDKDKIHSIPHYFLIWTPSDLPYGIIIVQHYTGHDISKMFVQHIQNFFKDQYGVLWMQKQKILPDSLMNEFRNNAVIKSITLSKSAISRPKRTAMRPILESKEKLKVQLVIKGLGPDTTWDQISSWLSDRQNGFLGVDLSQLDLEEGADRIVEYNFQGRSSRGKLTKNFQIIPSIVITDEVTVDNVNRHPDFQSIDGYARGFLNDVITHVGYKIQQGQMTWTP